MIEEVYQDKEFEVFLNHYHMNLEHFIEISNEILSMQRKVKSANQAGAYTMKIRGTRFVVNERQKCRS